MFSPTLENWLQKKSMSSLGPGKKKSQDKQQVLSQMFRGMLWEEGSKQIVDYNMANSCEAGLWLAYNDLWKAHDICDAIHTIEGSYWHAIMHRREPDIPNSNYWFQRVGKHVIWENLLMEAKQCLEKLGNESGDSTRFQTLLTASEWDPIEFNRICGQVRGSGSKAEKVCEEIQDKEWRLLFAYCYWNSIEN